MNKRYYPPLNEKSIKVVKQLYEDDPTFFEDRDCPYDPTVIELFTRTTEVIHKGSTSDYEDIDLDELMDEDNLLREVSTLYSQLKSDGEDMRRSDTSSEKNTYFKLSASLLERLLTMKERIINIKKMNEFTREVLNTLDDTLTADQRTTVMKRLRSILEEE